MAFVVRYKDPKYGWLVRKQLKLDDFKAMCRGLMEVGCDIAYCAEIDDKLGIMHIYRDAQAIEFVESPAE